MTAPDRPLAILLTGAAGGIGGAAARALARPGCRFVLVDRDGVRLERLAAELRQAGAETHVLSADLARLDDLPELVARADAFCGGLDVLINVAGLLSFRPFERETAESLLRLHTVNVLAPMVLAREAATVFRRRGGGQIVNVGSIFGSIGCAWFSSYSASKFALRGFSEALRRELAGTRIQVTYVAPRATRTALADVFGRMAEAVGMRLDPPERVGRILADAVRRRRADVYIGFPESLFVRINALLPRLVDLAMARQDARAAEFAVQADEAHPAAGTPPPGEARVAGGKEYVA